MSDVLLFSPPRRLRHVDEEVGENIGMGYVTAALRRKGISVTSLDAGVEGWNLSRSMREIQERPWRVLGLSLILPTMVRPAISLLRHLDRPGLVVLGGHTPSLAPQMVLKDAPRADVVVVGEGEITMVDLVSTFLQDKSWDSLAGLALRKDGDVVRTKPQPLIENLDDLAPPDRTYLSRVLARGGDALISSSRGCYNACVFCSVGAFYRLSPGPKWRGRSPGPVVDEIETLVRDYGAREIRFSDDNFIGPGQNGKERAAAIARELIQRRLPFRFEVSVRADDVDEDLFRLLKEAGLYRVFLGVEAGVDDVLRRFAKNVTVEENRRAVATLRRLGLEPYIGFMLFDPETTLNELIQNLAFLQEIRGRDGLVNSRLDLLNRLEVYEGTPVSARLRAEGRLLGNYLDYRYPFRDTGVSLVYGALRLVQRLLVPTRRLYGRARRRLKGKTPVSMGS